MDLTSYGRLLDEWEAHTARLLAAAGEGQPDPRTFVALAARSLHARLDIQIALELATHELTKERP